MSNNTYTWRVNYLVTRELEDHSQVVSVVNFSVHVTQGAYTSYVRHDVELNIGAIVDFTPYAQLTEGQVIEWVMMVMKPDEVAQLLARADASLTHVMGQTPRIETTLPWPTELPIQEV